jgi:hypothetical protein
MRKFISLMFAGFAAPALLAAQKPAAAGVATVEPGMSRAQVVAAIGQPYSSRSRESFTYLLYKNGCVKACGMDDLVVLDNDKVVDAVFRSPARRYTGTSSSPHMITAEEAAAKGGDSTAHTLKPKSPPKATIAAPKPAPKSAPKSAPPVVSKSATPAAATDAKSAAKPATKVPSKSVTKPATKPATIPDSSKTHPNPAAKKPGD